MPAASGVHMPNAPASHVPGFTINLAGVPIPLRRTFAAIDRLFSIPIEVLGDTLEKKMKGNVDAHVEAVQKKRKKRGKNEKIDDPSPKVTRTIADWAINASGVEPEDKDMSALWEAVLDAIMDDEDEGEQLLKIVKEANRSDIRYPDKIFDEGALLTVDITKDRRAMQSGGGAAAASTPRYELCLEEIDELVAAIFRYAKINPSAFFGWLEPAAREFMHRENKSFPE